jgi:predicted DNA binding CopG/RHH family protein
MEYSNKKDTRLSIRMNKVLLQEIKHHANNADMTLHDFIMIRCATPKDRKIQLGVESVQRR